jgi:hypothetical protein
LAAKVAGVEAAWRAGFKEPGLEELRAAWNGPGTAALSRRDISALRHFTPTQIRAWFPEAGRRPGSLLAALASSLSPAERSQVEGALADVFQGAGADWRQGYDFLVIVFP